MGACPHRRALPLSLLTVTLTIALSADPATAQPAQPDETLPGFKPQQVYHSGPVDNVNLNSGDLAIAIPLGPSYSLSPGLSWQLKAYYSSKLWEMEFVPCSGPQDQCFQPPLAKRAYARGFPTLGVGWTLHLGMVAPPVGPATGRYLSPDGGTHFFSSGDGTTSDGTDLKVLSQSGSWVVYHSDGTQFWYGRHFTAPNFPNYDLSNYLVGDGYVLSYVKDRFGQTVLEVGYTSAESWMIDHVVLNQDPSNRTIRFHWNEYIASDGQRWPVLASVEFPVLSSPTTALTVSFDRKTPASFRRSEFNYNPPGAYVTCPSLQPVSIDLPFLDSITQLTGTYGFGYYRTNDPNYPDGVMTQLTLPGGGAVAYGYQRWTVVTPCVLGPNSGCGNPQSSPLTEQQLQAVKRSNFDTCSDAAYNQQYIEASPAVIIRSETDPVTGLTSQTTYVRDQVASKNIDQDDYPSPHRVARRVVASQPDGNGGTVATTHVLRDGYEVLRRSYSGGDSTTTLIRSVETCYARLGIPPDPTLRPLCGVMESEGGRILDETSTNFLQGRFRELTWYGENPFPPLSCITSPGTLPCNDCLGAGVTTPCVQNTKSDFNVDADEYRIDEITANSFLTGMPGWSLRRTTTNWIPQTGPWLIKLFDWREVTDIGSVPSPNTVKRTYEYNLANGFLNADQVTDGSALVRRQYGSDASDPYGKYPETELLTGSGSGLSGSFTTYRAFQLGLLTSTRRLAWKSFDVRRDLAAGLITSSFDPNGLETDYGYDELRRLKSVTPPSPDAGTTITYDADNRGVTVSRSGADGNGAWARYLYDGLGRVIREMKRMPGAGNYAVRTHGYSANGQESFVSEWGSCSGPSSSCLTTNPAGTTYSNFDPFGRARQIQKADGSLTTVDFTDGAIQYSDTLQSVTTQVNTGAVLPQTAATTQTRKDVLGRVISVTEPGGDVTNYQYNVLDKLAQVTQGGQTRTFVYDSFGFLRSENHPEKGETDYSSYDALGNVLTKVDVGIGGITSQYTYDTAGRLGKIATGSSGQTVYSRTCYLETADCPSGLPASSNSNGKVLRTVGYNPFLYESPYVIEDFDYAGPGGRLSTKTTTFSARGLQQLTESFFYNSLGLLRGHVHPRVASAITFPFVVATEYDQALPVRMYLNGLQLVKAVAYQPSGALAGYTTGLGMNVDVTTSVEPDGVLPRPKRIYATLQDASKPFNLDSYSYDGTGNIVAIGSDVFGYDPRSRLAYAGYPSSGSQQFSYDRFGNMTARSGVNAQSFTIDASTNHIASNAYLRGNLTGPTGSSYTWDDLDRMAYQSFGSWAYLYNAENERIGKQPQGLDWTLTLRDPEKRVSTEFSGSTPSRDNVFLGNLLVASYANTNVGANNWSWSFYSSDHLGTPRLVTYMQVLDSDSHKYWPYGDEVQPQTAPQRLRFAAMEADSESSRFYDHARHHDFGLARFLSPDKLSGKLDDAQSWNRYAYARNNPLNVVDPDGRAGLGTVAYNLSQTVPLIASTLGITPQQLGNYAQLAQGSLAVASGVTGLLSYGGMSAMATLLPVAAGPAAPSLAERARDIQNALTSPVTRDHITTAVGTVEQASGEIVTTVASSEKFLRPVQIQALRAGEQAVGGLLGHAEATIINSAKAAGAAVKAIAPSRPPCPECAQLIRDVGATLETLPK